MYRWETTVTNRQLEEEITAVGTILNISVTERGVGGIVKKVRVEGSDGIMTINGEGQVRAKLGNPYMKITKNDGNVMKDIESLPSRTRAWMIIISPPSISMEADTATESA